MRSGGEGAVRLEEIRAENEITSDPGMAILIADDRLFRR